MVTAAHPSSGADSRHPSSGGAIREWAVRRKDPLDTAAAIGLIEERVWQLFDVGCVYISASWQPSKRVIRTGVAPSTAAMCPDLPAPLHRRLPAISTIGFSGIDSRTICV